MAKILLVEDDNNLREIYEARLQAEGYDIVSAKDGEEALSIAKKEQPDLIISDVMMPRISGFEMLDILRNTEGLKDVKVIMLTALGQAEDKTRADKLGADRYLVKSQVTLEDIVKSASDLLIGEPAVAPVAAPATPVAAPVAMPVAVAPAQMVPTAPPPTPQVTPEIATVAQAVPPVQQTATPTPSASTIPPAPVAAPASATPVAPTIPPVPTPAPVITPPPVATPLTPPAVPTAPALAPPTPTVPVTASTPVALPPPAPTPTPTAIATPPVLATVPVATLPNPTAPTQEQDKKIANAEAQDTATEQAAVQAQIDTFTAGTSPVPTADGNTVMDAAVKDLISGSPGTSPEPAKPIATETPTQLPTPPAPIVPIPGLAPATPVPTPAPVITPPPVATPPASVPEIPSAPPTEQDTPLAPTPAPVIPTPPASAKPSIEDNPKPATSNVASSVMGDNVTISNKKIIKPLPDTGTNTEPNLHELLAKEGINPDGSTPEMQTSDEMTGLPGMNPMQHQPGHVISPTATNANGAPIDPNSISL